MTSDSEQPNTEQSNCHLAAPLAGSVCGDKAVEQPRYQHDCSACVFLGTYDRSDASYPNKFDLYYHHDARPVFETVIARFGSHGAYYSGLDFARPYVDIGGMQHEGIAPLVEAKRRAVARSLMKGQA